MQRSLGKMNLDEKTLYGGVVRRYNNITGRGTIWIEDANISVRFHVGTVDSGCATRHLVVGDNVVLQITSDERGVIATSVRLADN